MMDVLQGHVLPTKSTLGLVDHGSSRMALAIKREQAIDSITN